MKVARPVLPSSSRLAMRRPPSVLSNTLQGRFESRVRQAPMATALSFEGENLTYDELNRRANRLCHLLQEQCGSDDQCPIGLCLERSPELIVGILAILKAGRAYLPLDPLYPSSRLQWTLQDAGAPLVITNVELAPAFAAAGTKALALDTAAQDLSLREESNPPAAGSEGSTAYIIYTSGSTGLPKGVLISHQNALRLLDATDPWFGFRGDDVWTLFHSIAFDFSVWEIWGALLYGGRLVVVPYGASRSPREFYDLLVREKVTVLNQTPSAFRSLVRIDGEVPEACRHELRLRWVIFGGEALDLRALAPWWSRREGQGPQLVNMYGITETTVHVTFRPLSASDLETSEDPGIGEPISDLSLHLLDARGQVVPGGSVGEICVGGLGLAQGYLGRPGLTAQRFIPDGCSSEPGQRLYRSGDEALRRDDGELEYRGRLDLQLKLRGFRIEAGEIEAALVSLPEVLGAVVGIRREGDGDERLVAYLEVAASAPADLHEIAREALKQSLPEHMVPSAFATLDTFPLTVNGKIDRKSLAEEPIRLLRSEFAAPRPGMEEDLARIWQEALSLDRVSRTDHFLLVGGHSLLATRVLARIWRDLGIRMRFDEMLAAPLLWTQAEKLVQLRMQSPEGGGQPSLTTAPEGPRRLSFPQERMWFFDQLNPGSNAFNLAFALEFEGPLDPRVLEGGLADLQHRHHALRARFLQEKGTPYQVVALEQDHKLPVVDLSRLPETRRRKEEQRLFVDGQSRAFDLSSGSLLRSCLLRSSFSRSALLLVVHHIACDGWSIGPFAADLSAAYGARRVGRSPDLPPLQFQYADFADWQRRWLDSPAGDEDLRYWQEKLRGWSTGQGQIPLDEGLATTGRSVGVLRRVLDKDFLERLRIWAAPLGATVPMVLLSGLYTLLGRYTGASDLTLGTLVANRTQVGIEGLIGCFINTLPLRCSISTEDSVRSLVEKVKGVTSGAYAHQEFPYEKILQEVGSESSGESAGLFQVLAVHQKTPLPALDLPGLRWRLLEISSEDRQAAFDLAFFFREEGLSEIAGDGEPGSEALSISLEFDQDRFSRETASGMVEDLLSFLRQALTDPDTRLEEIPLPSGRHPGARAPSPVQEEVSSPDSVIDPEARVAERQSQVSLRRSRLSAKQKALLARKLKGPRGPSPAAGDPEEVPRPQVLDGMTAPLSFGQERLWFLQRLEPESSAYNLVDAFELRGPITIRALHGALEDLHRRQGILRTAFFKGDEGPAQIIRPVGHVPLPFVDLSALGDRADEAAQLLLRGQGRIPFDLGSGKPSRALLLRWSLSRHGLIFAMHHCVADAWAFSIFARELTAFYQARRGKRPASLPPLPLQYGEYAADQRRTLTEESLGEDLQWWRDELRGAPQVLELPSDRPRPAARSGSGFTLERILPRKTEDRLGGFLQNLEGTTAFMVFLAAFQALVSRTTYATDFLLGSPSTFRDRTNLEGLIGLFVNTLVLRADLSRDPTFEELLARVRKTTLDVFEHQRLPFERLVDDLRPERSLSHLPLIQAVFVFESTPRSEITLPGLTIRPWTTPTSTAKFDLTVMVRPTPDGMILSAEAAQDLFEESTIERLLQGYSTLLDEAISNPELRISRLGLLGDREREQVLAWNASQEPPAPQGTLHGRFEAQALRASQRIAISSAEGEQTYAQLNRQANRLAHLLRERGVRRGEPVGLCLERSGSLIVGVLAILKAGGAYLPLDPHNPVERLQWILEDAAVRWIVSDGVHASALAAAGTGAQGSEPIGFEVLALDTLEKELQGYPDTNPQSGYLQSGYLWAGNEARDLAYIIYTSGSTGRPKGVLIPHGNALGLFDATEPWFGFSTDDVWALFHSIAFDFSVWELWGALLYGGRLVIIPFDVSRSPQAFHALLRREGITVLNQTPSAFQGLMRADGEASEDQRRELELRWIIFGGEALEVEALAPWWAHHDSLTPGLVNMYGITETTVHVTFRPLTPADGKGGRDPGIGRAIPNLSLRLLDPAGAPVPIGIPGEICVGGGGLARGYLGRPARTAERFIPQSFGGLAGSRLYRSGDLARYRPDGSLEYLGRIDHQLKIRGFRIEAGEIEAALLEVPGVEGASVGVRRDSVRRDSVRGDSVRGDSVGGDRLVAYVALPEGSREPFEKEARSHLRSRLPEHMVPSVFVPLEALPLTANGKVDRKGLAGLPLVTEPKLAFVPPKNPTERRIAAIWGEVLGQEEVSVEETFFDLGGHSLLLVETHGRLEKAFEQPIPMIDLFRYSTVRSLAGHLQDEPQKESSVAQGYSRAQHRRTSARRRSQPNRRSRKPGEN